MNQSRASEDHVQRSDTMMMTVMVMVVMVVMMRLIDEDKHSL
jgi:hypothetical protein